MSASTRSGAWGAPPTMNQPYNQPYQEPYQPYQQQDYPSYNEPSYQPYQQGYQAPQRGYEQGEPEYRYPEQLPERSENVQYEQPQAQYPEELPPMRQ